MNKIVNELFNRAGGWTEVCDVSGKEILTYNENLDPEKFAELIVLECMHECLRMQLGNQYTPEELLFQVSIIKLNKVHIINNKGGHHDHITNK